MTAHTHSNADMILMHLGGRHKLKAAIGAKNFFSDNDGDTLVFKIGTGAHDNIKHIRIHLNAQDTLDVTFSTQTRKKDPAMGIFLPVPKVVSTHEGLYIDMLQSVIEDATGFYLRPFG